MTEFQKAKVGFALALLGVVFALNPIIEQYVPYGFDLLGVKWTVGAIYAGFGGLLGAAVYIFAVDFAIDRPLPWVQSAGNFVYVLALTIIPAYGLLFVGYLLVEAIGQILESEAIRSVMQIIAGIVVGFSTALAIQGIRSRLASSERVSVAGEYDKQEASFMERANQLTKSGHWDMAVLEAYRAIELAVRATLLRRGYPPRSRNTPYSLIRWAIDNEIVPSTLRKPLQTLRVARNSVAHGKDEISKEQAESLLEEARNVLSELRRFEERGFENAT